MHLNLHFLIDDLTDLAFKGAVSDGLNEAPCAYPVLCEELPSSPKAEALYLIDAAKLPKTVPPRLRRRQGVRQEPRISIACFGAPPRAWLDADVNIVYSSLVRSLSELANAVIGEFSRYAEWEATIQQMVAERRPLADFAKASVDLFGNPMYGQSSLYRILFFELPSNRPNSAIFANYIRDIYEPAFTEGGELYLSDDAISWMSADLEYRQAADSIGAYIYSGEPFGFRTLYYNCRIGDVAVARITVDEIVRPLFNRDFHLLSVLGSYISQAWSNEPTNLFDMPRDYSDIMEGLLSHRLIPVKRIADLLERLQWDMLDEYVLFTLKSGAGIEAYDLAMTQFSLNIARNRRHLHFLPFDGRSVFVCDLTAEGCTREELISSLKPILRDQLSKASFSSSFYDFKDLYYYYKQALAVEDAGTRADPMFWIYRFEDYALATMLDNCLQGSIPPALFPHGLMELIIHDDRKGTDYVHMLRLYLDNDRNIAKTARDAFLHRNTLLYQLDRIQEIVRMDLDNPDNRIVLQLALRAYDIEMAHPSERRYEYKMHA